VCAFPITFHAVAEPQPGARWQVHFERLWPGYRSWYLLEGDAARPTFALARRMLHQHMPELVPTWERLVELAGGGDLAGRLLTLYDPPPLVRGCSQAVFGSERPLLVRNYDYDPARFEGAICATDLAGRRVIGSSDCLWGLLDGINDAGLAVSLAFGGRRVSGPGFAIPIVLRYLLEVCETAHEARRVLGRLPIQVPYNVTILDRSGGAVTAFVSPDRRLRWSERELAVTNHQRVVEWPAHASATRTLERQRRMLELLSNDDETAFVAAFLEPPLHTQDYSSGFGTLYTAVYRPVEGAVEYRWPGESWQQSFEAFAEGARTVMLAGWP
jgi:predicted choloylglycine hydrolase